MSRQENDNQIILEDLQVAPRDRTRFRVGARGQQTQEYGRQPMVIHHIEIVQARPA